MGYRAIYDFLILGLVAFAAGCAGSPGPEPSPATATPDRSDVPLSPAPTPEERAFARDRAAILGLAGAYDVAYRYEEMVALRAGYTPTPAQEARAREWVLVVEDTGDRIGLQHLLLVGESALVVKHWRQDWRYAPVTALQYVDARIWRRAGFALAGRPGVWTRSVTEADGGPAYTNWGRWSHDDASPVEPSNANDPEPPPGRAEEKPASGGETVRSSWSSATPVLAPLPRRESARQNDYEVQWVQDRITSTPTGWTQRQSVTKSVFVPTVPPLVREAGVVTYRRAGGLDVAAAEAYWERVGPYWAVGRAAWAAALRSRRDVKVFSEANGRVRWRQLFNVVDAAVNANQAPESVRPKFDAV
ncbi:MAG: DUF6607 family protein, partial [Planctomycetota bacterium]